MASKSNTPPSPKRRRLSPSTETDTHNPTSISSKRKSPSTYSEQNFAPTGLDSTPDTESDISSVVSSSSEDEDPHQDEDQERTDGDGEHEIIHLSKAKKPLMRFQPTPPVSSPGNVEEGGLKERLDGFLPRLKKANEELVLGGEGRGFEILEEGGEEDEGDGEGEGGEGEKKERKEYISMELGLGVLEEKNEEEESSSDEEEVDGERDVLGKLMGSKGGEQGKKVGIEEVA